MFSYLSFDLSVHCKILSYLSIQDVYEASIINETFHNRLAEHGILAKIVYEKLLPKNKESIKGIEMKEVEGKLKEAILEFKSFKNFKTKLEIDFPNNELNIKLFDKQKSKELIASLGDNIDSQIYFCLMNRIFLFYSHFAFFYYDRQFILESLYKMNDEGFLEIFRDRIETYSWNCFQYDLHNIFKFEKSSLFFNLDDTGEEALILLFSESILQFLENQRKSSSFLKGMNGLFYDLMSTKVSVKDFGGSDTTTQGIRIRAKAIVDLGSNKYIQQGENNLKFLFPYQIRISDNGIPIP